MPSSKTLSNTSKAQIMEELLLLGVTVEAPETPKEISFAQALEAFAQFVLFEQPEQTQALLERYITSNNDHSVGELQGGNEQHSIYRVSILQQEPTEDPSARKHGAAEVLMEAFSVRYPQFSLTVEKLQHYMLTMCNKRKEKRQPYLEDRTYNRLGNLMFILSFGPVHGQVRHIDHMNPNLQICLYMSKQCPSTIIYATKTAEDHYDDPTSGIADKNIFSCLDLLHHWEATTNTMATTTGSLKVPLPLQTILTVMGDESLITKPYAKYFAKAWQNSLNAHLANFGRLYQPVAHSIWLQECDPGTILIAGGSNNHVHAGPPAKGPRMFAFAIGIPDETNNEEDRNGITTGPTCSGDVEKHIGERKKSVGDMDNEDQDGEVQYSPALLHIDLCCIIFGILDFEEFPFPSPVFGDEKLADEEMIRQTKRFLLDRLLPFLDEYPDETYSIHFGENRRLLREWLEELVPAQREGNVHRVESLLETAVLSDELMYSPDVATKSFRKHKLRQQRRNQRKSKQQTRQKKKQENDGIVRVLTDE